MLVRSKLCATRKIDVHLRQQCVRKLSGNDDRIRVALTDPHPAVLTGLRAFLSADPQIRVVGETNELTYWVDRRMLWAADVILVGHSLSELGRRWLEGNVEDVTGGACVLMTDEAGADVVVRAFVMGCRGVFYKGDGLEDLLDAIRAVRDGRIWCRHADTTALTDSLPAAPEDAWGLQETLTHRQKLVSELVARGLSNGQISRYVQVSEATVASDLTHIYRTLGVSDRVNLIVKLNG